LCQAAYEKYPYDGKTQVTLAEDGSIHSVVASFQNAPKKDLEKLVRSIIPDAKEYHVNPAGDWNQGGFDADAGLTGRKIIVDNYGPEVAVGGGAFSGKDPSKVDRSASYAARYVAKNVVAAGLAAKCEIQLAYAIGVAEPVSVMVDTRHTGKVGEEKLTRLVREHFDLTPRGIITELDLLKPIYNKTAAYGHFGREKDGFNWEKTDKVDLLKKESR